MTKHRVDVIIAALTADALQATCGCYYEHKKFICTKCGWNPNTDEDAAPTPAVVIPSVDYTKIPQEYAGKWVLIRIDSQEVVSACDSPEEAVGDIDTASLDFVLTKVPSYGADAEKEPYPNAPGDVRETGKGLVKTADAEKGERDG